MYEGYRLQIDGVKIPDSLIAKGTYSISKEDRIADSYEDAFLIEHIVTFDTTKTIISFSICEHDSDGHAEIAKMFRKRKNLEVIYYDDDTDSYLTGKFHMNKITYAHLNTRGRKINYASTPIALEEY